MRGAGKRITRPPLRYDPSGQYPSPILPATDFDLTMSGPDEANQSFPSNLPDSLESLAQLVSNMNDAFNAQLETISRKFSELDTRMDELCSRVDDNDTDVRAKFTQFQSSFNKDLIAMQNDISLEQQRSQDSQKSVNIAQQSLKETVKTLNDRISLTEGQGARLAALENKIQNSISFNPPAHNNSQSIPQTSFNNILTSTTMSNSVPTYSSIPLNTSSFPVLPLSNTIPNNTISTYTNNTLSNVSGINFDSTKLPTYNGTLSPTHPEEFLEHAEQYFLTQPPVPDQFKINYIKSKFVDDARLWYNTLLPPPSVYTDFLMLFRNHFWSTNQQRAIRNELYRPYFHRDSTSLQKHAMDWISKARFLQPPIDQAEMVDQIISHFTFNISVALRGLRITTTNELIQQLSHLQQSHSSSNPQTTQSNSASTPPNSYHHPNGHNNQNRYPPRQNNYHPRPQHNNNNNQSSQPDNIAASSGN